VQDGSGPVAQLEDPTLETAAVGPNAGAPVPLV
jgi:hypothetical protein